MKETPILPPGGVFVIGGCLALIACEKLVLVGVALGCCFPHACREGCASGLVCTACRQLSCLLVWQLSEWIAQLMQPPHFTWLPCRCPVYPQPRGHVPQAAGLVAPE